MIKEEYLERLSKLIRRMPKEYREDILSDYEEHFAIGVEKGRTEEEISEALGNPETVAKQFKIEYMIKKAEDKPSVGSMFEALFAAAGMGIFNLIFVLGPVMIIMAVILGLLGAGLAMIFSGIFTTISPLLQLIFPNLHLHPQVNNGIWDTLWIIGEGIGLMVVGIAIVVFMAYVTKWFYRLMIRYLKLNMKIIKGKK